MANPIKAYLKSIHVASTSQSQKKAALTALNKSLGTNFDSHRMFEQIHKSLLRMIDDYAIFGCEMNLIQPMIQANMWITVAQQIENFINNRTYPKLDAETPLRRGLIQIYLYYFASRYLNRPEYTFKFIQSNFLNLKNLNRLQMDRELVFSELLVRMKAVNKVNKRQHETSIPFIKREKVMREVSDQLQDYPFLMLIGPQGMGKSVTLKLIEESMCSKGQIYTYQFTARDQLSHPDYFANQMLAFFEKETPPSNSFDRCIFLLDDIHLLPPKLHQVLRNRVLAEVFKIFDQKSTEIAILATSTFPIQILMSNQVNSPKFLPYYLVEFDAAEVDMLWHASHIKTSYSPEEIYRATRGYPALVAQMISSGVTFDHSQWFYTIYNTVNWDESVTELMKALCTFRYIGPFFLGDLANFINDPYLLTQIWHIPEIALDSSRAHMLWEKLVYRNTFITRVSYDQKAFPMDKNFVILRVLRQLAENSILSDQPALYDQRHKLAADYFHSKVVDPQIPGSKKPLLIIEYFYHLAKLEVSPIQIISIGQSLTELAKSKEKPADFIIYTTRFLKHLVNDDELREIMGEELFNEIITITQKDLTA